jgi:hypothetical protein
VFGGGWIGSWGYQLGHVVEELPPPPHRPIPQPYTRVAFYDRVLRLTDGVWWLETLGRTDDVPELVAPRADPATAEHPALRDVGQVDVVERMAVEDAHGVEGDERLAVVPIADQRDEPVASAEATQDLDRLEPDVEADPTDVSRLTGRQ